MECGQILTLRNDPQTSLGWGKGQILTLKNAPSQISALRVVMKYNLHWNWMGSN